jgi:hypothetical protein
MLSVRLYIDINFRIIYPLFFFSLPSFLSNCAEPKKEERKKEEKRKRKQQQTYYSG